MSNVKITQLPLATTPLTGTEVFPLVQGTTTKQVSITGLFTSPVMTNPTLGTVGQADLINATGLPISTGVAGLGSGIATFLGTPSSANLRAAVTDETGTGSLVFANSPTLVTPNLGTPSAMVATNITGTALGLIAGSAITNANLTGAVTSVGNATSLGSFTSAQLRTALTDETGSGVAVFATSPTLVTPDLGTPSAGVLTNATGLPLTTGVTGTLGLGNGGTGQTTANAAFNALAPSQTGNSGKYLTTDGTNTSWATNPLGTVTSVGGTGTVSGISLSGTVTTSGNLTLGGALDLSAYNGAGAFTTLSASGAVTLSGGTANGVTYLNGSKVLTSGSALTFDGSTLGSGYLNIGSAASFQTNSRVAIQTSAGKFDIAAYGGSSVQLMSNGALAYYTPSNSFDQIWLQGASELMRLTSTGLGIGTSSPAAKLGVATTTAGYAAIFTNTNGALDSNGVLIKAGTTASEYAIRIADQNDSTTLFTVKGGGNVGIGTSSITSSIKTEIQQSTTGWSNLRLISASSKTSTTTEYPFYITTSEAWASNPFGLEITVKGNATSSSRVVGLNAATVNSTSDGILALNAFGGNVGIGTSSPGASTKLNVAGRGLFTGGAADPSDSTSAGVAINYNGTTGFIGAIQTGVAVKPLFVYGNNLIFGGSPTSEFMRIDSAGNLGLGVTPSAWNSSASVIEQKNGVAWYSFGAASNNVSITNAYYNSGGSFIYKTSDYASRYQQISGTHLWFTAPSGTAGTNISFTQAMTLDASGNFLVGTTSQVNSGSVSFLSNSGGTYTTNGVGIQDNSNGSGFQYLSFNGSGGTQIGNITRSGTNNAISIGSNTYLAFSPNFTEAGRFDSSGNLLVGTTSSSGKATINAGANSNGVFVINDTYDYQTLSLWNKAGANDNLFARFFTESSITLRGSITYNRAVGLTAYNTTSDYRAKDIIGPVTDSGALIDSTPVYMGKMKGATQERPMFIAHETPAYAHTGEKDAVDADGNPVYQQMDASALIPVMWAEIQSLRQRVAQLETN